MIKFDRDTRQDAWIMDFDGVTRFGSFNPTYYPPGADVQWLKQRTDPWSQGGGYLDPGRLYGSEDYTPMGYSSGSRMRWVAGSDALFDKYGQLTFDVDIVNGVITAWNTNSTAYPNRYSQSECEAKGCSANWGRNIPRPWIKFTEGKFTIENALTDQVIENRIVCGLRREYGSITNMFTDSYYLSAQDLTTYYSSFHCGFGYFNFEIKNGLIKTAKLGFTEYTSTEDPKIVIDKTSSELRLKTVGCNTNGIVTIPVFYGVVNRNRNNGGDCEWEPAPNSEPVALYMNWNIEIKNGVITHFSRTQGDYTDIKIDGGGTVNIPSAHQWLTSEDREWGLFSTDVYNDGIYY